MNGTHDGVSRDGGPLAKPGSPAGMDARLIRKVRRHDRIATRVITAGGVLVIVAVIGILVLIAQVALPLFFPPSIEQHAAFPLPRPPGALGEPRILALGLDEYLESGFVLDGGGVFTFFETGQGRVLDASIVSPPGGGRGRILRADSHGKLRYGLTWSGGGFSLVEVVFRPEFDDDGRRTITHAVETLAEVEALPVPGARLVIGRFQEESGLTLASLPESGGISLYRRVEGENLLGESSLEETTVQLELGVPGRVSVMILDEAGGMLYAGSDTGYLMRWDVSDLDGVRQLDVSAAFKERGVPLTMTLLLGEQTLAIATGGTGGRTQLSGWFPYRKEEGGEQRLSPVHWQPTNDAYITSLMPSRRGKTLTTLDREGVLRFEYFNTGRTLAVIEPKYPVRQAALSARANGLIALDAKGRVVIWSLDIPHPEVSWSSYFTRIWYEGYPEPAFVWQSSAGTDDFEPKLSLMPLIFGTLKGTFYGLLFAAPLGVLGALYTSSLMGAGMRRIVKPTFEIIGAVPTVVIGFLAALWLAPIIKTSLTAFLLMIGFLPLAMISSSLLFERLRNVEVLKKTVRGHEFIWIAPLLLLAVWMSFLAGHALDALLFSGSLADWLFSSWGVRMDQRNSIVIACAMGFAVLPTIFTISDDALVNVPRNLTAASLALGASRWQTVWRVVLPSASPGIFAALMMGLGRAVGETMIVLMATGNTPIMDWGPFNGMRTLAANIAVEIPEAPKGGTLYRTLFLSAVILFLTTMVLNSIAEVVRHRLRRKYGQF